MTAARPAPPASVPSPCVQVCVIDPASGLCLGCFRTLEEIAQWSRLSSAARTAIMAELDSRRGRIDPAKLS